MLHTVVMAGGSGTRFWPQSRRDLPKQFLSIGTRGTLIQETAERCLPLSTAQRLWVVTGRHYAEQTRLQLPDVPPEQILLEPCPRNTSPCIGLAAIQLLAVDPEAIMLIVPADHVIQPVEAFHAAVRKGVEQIERHPDNLVLFGVAPTYASTGFGYIERGAELPTSQGCFEVQAFREKPDANTAQAYLAGKKHLWNCGIFLWKARTILDELARWQPALHSRLLRLAAVVRQAEWDAALSEEFPAMESISIDYAVLEHAAKVCLIPAPFEWDDVGSWQALARLLPEDEVGNTIDGLHCGVETSNCIIRGAGDHLIATVGVQDLIIVHTPAVTLVADRRDESAVKKLLSEVERRGLSKYL